MNKCKSCLHLNKVNEQKYHCNYQRCVKEEGWIADKKRGVNNNIIMWTEKGWTKDCQCGEKINYLSRICPYCHEGVKNDD